MGTLQVGKPGVVAGTSVDAGRLFVAGAVAWSRLVGVFGSFT